MQRSTVGLLTFASEREANLPPSHPSSRSLDPTKTWGWWYPARGGLQDESVEGGGSRLSFDSGFPGEKGIPLPRCFSFLIEWHRCPFYRWESGHPAFVVNHGDAGLRAGFPACSMAAASPFSHLAHCGDGLGRGGTAQRRQMSCDRRRWGRFPKVGTELQ